MFCPWQTAVREKQLEKLPSERPQLFVFIHELTMSCFNVQRLVFPQDTFVNVEALHMYGSTFFIIPPKQNNPGRLIRLMAYYLQFLISVSDIIQM